jgi:hypothetical protein
MIISVCKSDYFIERAKQICLSPVEYEAQPNTPVSGGKRSYDTGVYPFLDFTFLIKIRNDIIHYEMPFYDENNSEPNWAKFLKRKDVFLEEPVVHPPSPLPDEGRRIWVEEICTLKGAIWAYNTSCSMMKEFYKLARGVVKQTCQPFIKTLPELRIKI